jgi:hypothetical protein
VRRRVAHSRARRRRPRRIGATVNWSGSLTVATGFTITAENCEFCKGEPCREDLAQMLGAWGT